MITDTDKRKERHAPCPYTADGTPYCLGDVMFDGCKGECYHPPREKEVKTMNRNLDKIAARYEMCMETAETLLRNSFNRQMNAPEPIPIPVELLGHYARVTGSIASSLYIEMNKKAGAWDEGFGMKPTEHAPDHIETPEAEHHDGGSEWPEVLACRNCGAVVSRKPSKYETPFYYPCEKCNDPKTGKPTKSLPKWYLDTKYPPKKK